MIRGIYAAASGMVANFRRQLILSNNISNVSTPGYKQDVTSSSEFANLLMATDAQAQGGTLGPWDFIGPTGAGTELDAVKLDMSQGDLTETGNPLDLAISGPGYFAVQTPSGTAYTRNGTFFRDALGRLTTADGGLVLGDDGPIQIGAGDIAVSSDGTVSAGGEVAGRVRLVDFGPQENMVKTGNNYLAPENPAAQEGPAQRAAISQGFLEHSNVDLAKAMVDVMSAMRSYEASQKMIQLQDQTLAAAVSEVGKV
ncbi:MAG: flagellar basal-body rod protein FlgF [Bacteroidetes bacterium]|nr:flagellar basal-body rod protein FlgF [Bacteroidota bacterium]MCL5027287.1 flagellar basal-body rod protein FlgF [Chloroflexota bacterium]